jgi:TRAP-type C4-dicarboxylate transport system permease small subunit
MKIDLMYLLKKAWFLIVFAGFLGYMSFENSAGFWDYAPSRIFISAFLPASFMYAGLIVGFTLGCNKKK